MSDKLRELIIELREPLEATEIDDFKRGYMRGQNDAADSLEAALTPPGTAACEYDRRPRVATPAPSAIWDRVWQLRTKEIYGIKWVRQLEVVREFSRELNAAPSRPVQPTDDALYAAYANHCAIQGKPLMTRFTWRKAGKPNAPQPVQPASASLRDKFAQRIHFKLAAAQNMPYKEGDTCEECYGVADEFLALVDGPTCHKCGKLVETGDVLCSEHEVELLKKLMAAQPGVRSPDLVIERMRDWNYGAFLDETEASCIAIGTTAQEALNNGMRELLKRQPGVREGELSEDDLHELAEDIICRYGRAKDPATHDPKQWDLHVTGVERLLRAALLRSKESA